MPVMSYTEFSRSNISGQIYLFFGEEAFLVSSALKRVEKSVQVDILNREVFYGYDSSSEDILNALQTFPLLNEKRLIIVKEVNKLNPQDAQKLSDYLDNPVDTSCLVLSYIENYKKDTSEKRKNLIDKCIKSKYCMAVECKKLYDRDVKIFIRNKFNAMNKSISPEAINMIVEENGCDLQNVSEAIEKLILFNPKDKKSIMPEDIEAVSGYSKDINIFKMINYIENKNLSKSLFVLAKLLEQGEEPVKILISVYSCIKRLLNAKSMIEEGKKSIQDIKSFLKIHPYFQNQFIENLQSHKLKTLKECLNLILEADIILKTGAGDFRMAFEKILISICSK